MKFTFLREIMGRMPSLLGTLMSFWRRSGGNAVCAYQIEGFLYSVLVRQPGLGM